MPKKWLHKRVFWSTEDMGPTEDGLLHSKNCKASVQQYLGDSME